MGLGDKKRWRGLDKSLMALILRNNSIVYMKYVVDVSSMFDVLYIIVYGLLWLIRRGEMSAGRFINCTDSDSDFDKGGVDNRRSQQNQPIDFSRILCFVSFNNFLMKYWWLCNHHRSLVCTIFLFCIFCCFLLFDI